MRASRLPFSVLLIVATWLFVLARPANGQTTQAYIVTDSNDNLTRVYSTSNDQLITQFRTGITPFVVQVSPDGRFAFVPHTNSNYVSVFDLTIGAEIFRVEGDRNASAAVSPDGAHIATGSVLPQLPSATVGVAVINTADFSQTTQSAASLLCDNSTPQNCDSLAAVAIADGKAYFNASGPLPAGVVVADLNNSQTPLSIASGSNVGSSPFVNSIAATPDGKDVVTIEYGPNGMVVLVIDTGTDTVVQNLTLDIAPQAVAITADSAAATDYAYFLGQDSSGNNVVEAYKFSGGSLSGPVAKSTAMLQGFFNRAALSPDGTRLYLAQVYGGEVVVMNASTLAVIEQLQVGTSIDAITTANIQTQTLSTAPVITSVSPQVAVNNTSTTVQITGSNFTSDAMVRFGDLPPVPATLSGSTLQATVPAGVAAQGADIVVTDPDTSQPPAGQHQSGILRGQFTITSSASFQPSNQVVVDDAGEASVGILNGSTTNTLFQTTPGLVAAIPVGVAITPDGLQAYLGGFTPALLYNYNILNSSLAPPIPVTAPANSNGNPSLGGQEDPVAAVNSPVTGGGPAAYFVSNVVLPDSNFDLAISVVDANPNDTSTFNTVVKQFTAGLDMPDRVVGGLAVTPDGRYVYGNCIAGPGGFDALQGYVVVFDVETGNTNILSTSTMAPVPISGFQGHIEVSPDGKSLLLLTVSGGVGVFDIGTNPMQPSYITTISGTPPAGFGPLNFLEYRIPKNVPNELIAFDSLQNVIQIFNFDRSAGNFSLLGSVTIPGTPGVRDEFGMDVTPDGQLIYALLISDDAVAVVDASNPSSPVLLTKIRTGLAPQSVAVRPGTPTQTGSNVSVQPVSYATINFEDVSAPGATTVTTTNTTPTGPPPGFQLAGVPIYYNISTSAVFSGPVVVCFGYNPNLLPAPESNLRLAHYDTTLSPPGWVDATVSLDTSAHRICGQVTSFSPFVIGGATPTFEFDSLISAISDNIQPEGIMRSLRATALAARASYTRGQPSTAASQLQALEQEITTDAASWPAVASEQEQLDDIINSILGSLQ